jgi:hypothetical protein
MDVLTVINAIYFGGIVVSYPIVVLGLWRGRGQPKSGDIMGTAVVALVVACSWFVFGPVYLGTRWAYRRGLLSRWEWAQRNRPPRFR